MAKGELYRGYIVWTYDGKETVERVPWNGSDVWRSKQRLKERLQELLKERRPKVTMPKDLEAHIETIETKVLKIEDEDEE